MNAKYICTGQVYQIGDTQRWPSGFSKRTLVLKTSSGKYDNYAAFDFTREKTADLDRLRVGESVEVEFYLDAHESTKKPRSWFSSNRAVHLARLGAASAVEAETALEPEKVENEGANAACVSAQDDDMPF